jgi:formate hydrogenlyase subunit 6/NADH:ubiquinone oxidoreductase subunit I
MDVCVSAVLGKNIDTMDALSPSRCILCGHCKAICPENAIVLRGWIQKSLNLYMKKTTFSRRISFKSFFAQEGASESIKIRLLKQTN